MNPSSILVIDDEPNNFDVIETFLSEQEYQLYYADSGKQVIASLDIYQPDLILLDVMMPDIDGIEVCRQIKALSKWQAIPIIMVTALDSKADIARCLNAGADDFISKPVNALELRARVNAMLRIKHQYDELQRLLQMREDMVQMLVHDLRNPLSNIFICLELLKNPKFSEEKRDRKLDQIYLSSLELQGYIDELLQISLIESGKMRLNRTEVEVSDLIQTSLGKFQAIAARKNQSLISQFPRETKRKISVDVTLLQRVLENLISNAIKFSPLNSQILIKGDLLASGGVKIQVIDSGKGVPDELQQKIFEKYEIGTVMPDIAQIGLGLAFCKMVVDAHGGEIGVRNNQPTGAIFEITLTP
ncbi:MAG: hybrid sensor histidine kinase/response regulator [Oscillatoriaceae cyanobacterium]